MTAAERYVEQREDNWYVADSRIELYSVIAAWRQGMGPEEIQTSLPVLSQAEVYGAILFYLEHRDEIDTFFRKVDARYRAEKATAESADPAFHEMMRGRMTAYNEAQEPHLRTRDSAAS